MVVLGCVSDAEPLPSESVRSYYNLILKKAGQFLTHLQVNLLRFALSLRTYSPAVAASQQVCGRRDASESGVNWGRAEPVPLRLSADRREPGSIPACGHLLHHLILRTFLTISL